MVLATLYVHPVLHLGLEVPLLKLDIGKIGPAKGLMSMTPPSPDRGTAYWRQDRYADEPNP